MFSSSARKFKQLALIAVLAVINVVSFQNCGADFAVRSDLSMGGGFQAGASCESQLQGQFQSTYAPFLSTTCKGCHVPGGAGKGAFAQSDKGGAFSAFLLATSNRIDTLAVSSSHAPGVTGPGNESAISSASQAWNAAVTNCKAGTGEDTGSGAVTSDKAMNATATDKDITWNLDSEMSVGTGNYGGATLTIAVRAVTANNYTTHYFNRPRLKAGTRPLHAESIMLKINGQLQNLGTIWSLTSGDVPAGQTVTLSTVQLFLEHPTLPSDTLAISFGKLEAQ
ncbi:MAG: hypothetical protein EOP05_10780 [Proteobacteria bacterium]|nr:MAG: hypothetical protein EOP05_10780 [Pseudomonadota bacterium]